MLRDVSSIARNPGFDVNAVLRHRVTADVALLKLAHPLALTPAPLPAGGAVAAGDAFLVIGLGLAKPGDGKAPAAPYAAPVLSPPASPARYRSDWSIPPPTAPALDLAPAPAIPARRCSATSAVT